MDTTVAIPSVGTEAYFDFKDPYSVYIRNKFNINTLGVRLKVISIISMRDMIRVDLRDPYSEIYQPAGLSEVEYKKDLNNNIYLISFSFRTCDGVERYVRVPLNYVASQSDSATVEYTNRIIMLDLGYVPKDLELTPWFSEFIDYVAKRTGVSPEVKDVSVGNVHLVTQDDHELRETIRENSATVHKTLNTLLEEKTLMLDGVMNRLKELNISLG